MRALGIGVGILAAAIGLLGVASPPTLLRIGKSMQTPAALYIVTALRIAFGIVLIRAAPLSHLAPALRVLGVLMILIGAATPFAGLQTSHAVLEWWTGQGLVVLRAVALLPLALGVFVLYALGPRRS